MCENRVLVLPVNILTVWHAGFTWPHNTLPCVLIKACIFKLIVHCTFMVPKELELSLSADFYGLWLM